MRFTVSSSYLSKKLQTLVGVVNGNNTMPILDNFLFELEEPGKLVVWASDLETTIKASLEVESTSLGKIAVPAKLLLDTLKTLAEQPITFSVKEDNRVKMKIANGDVRMAYLDGEEFPNPVTLSDASSVSVRGDVLARAIQKTIFAVGNDDLRPIMNGVFFQFSPERLTFVATDAHKLVKYDRTDYCASEVAEFVVPKKPLGLLKSSLSGYNGDVTIEYNENNVRFSFDNIEYICRLLDGTYPNYDAVIPKENPNKLTVDRVQFLNASKRVSIFANKSTYQVRLRMAGTDVQLFAEDIDYSNKAEERLLCEYHGEDMEIGFNSRFLVEILNNLDSQNVTLEMSYPNRAGIITPIEGLEEGEFVLMLAMPIMLNTPK